jgi:hypothetical protein
MHIRATFALDEPTTEGLAQLAKRWGVSKSEALRRAVARAQEQPGPGGPMTPQDALRALKRKPLVSGAQARGWRAENARARRESDGAAARAPAKSRKGTP